MEHLEQYRQRTGDFMMHSLSYTGTLETNPNLRKKVNEQGNFCPFFGDTIVFQLDESVINLVSHMQKKVYQNCGYMLAAPIDTSTFHVTLHDLSNGNVLQDLSHKMEQNRQQAHEILQKRDTQSQPIRVRTVGVFSMVNTSVVLGLEPADDASCLRLMKWYERFQTVVPLNYPLTLHITLGYYKPGVYSNEQREHLAQVFSEINQTCGHVFTLDENKLVYQRFDDMNRYY